MSAIDDFADLPLRMAPKDLAKHLPSTSEKTLERWRSLGQGPLYSKCSGKVYYLKSDVVAWIVGNRHESPETKKPGVAAPGQNTEKPRRAFNV